MLTVLWYGSGLHWTAFTVSFLHSLSLYSDDLFPLSCLSWSLRDSVPCEKGIKQTGCRIFFFNYQGEKVTRRSCKCFFCFVFWRRHGFCSLVGIIKRAASGLFQNKWPLASFSWLSGNIGDWIQAFLHARYSTTQLHLQPTRWPQFQYFLFYNSKVRLCFLTCLFPLFTPQLILSGNIPTSTLNYVSL